MITGAVGSVGGVLTAMRTSTVDLLTTVDDLHLYACRTEEPTQSERCGFLLFIQFSHLKL